MDQKNKSKREIDITTNQKKERTTLKILFQQCLNKKEQDSLRNIQGMQSLYSATRMWENEKYLEIRRMGLDNYLNKVISKGASLTSEGIVYISHALKNSKGLNEITRTKVTYFKI
jgi:hypothetical protein